MILFTTVASLISVSHLTPCSSPLSRVSSAISGSYKTFTFPLLWGEQETAPAVAGLKQMGFVHCLHDEANRKGNGWMITALPWGDTNQTFGKLPPVFVEFLKMVTSLGGFPFLPDWMKFADSLKVAGRANRWTDSHHDCISPISLENQTKNSRKYTGWEI